MENLNTPIESQDLLVKNTTSTNKSVYSTCFDFQNIFLKQQSENQLDFVSNNNQLNAIIGAEDGLVHSLNINKYNLFQNVYFS